MIKKVTALITFVLALLPLGNVFPAEIPCPDFKCYFEREALKKERAQIIQREEQENFRTNQLLLQEEELKQRERQNDLQEEQIQELKAQTRLQEESLKIEKESNQRDLELREKDLKEKQQIQQKTPDR